MDRRRAAKVPADSARVSRNLPLAPRREPAEDQAMTDTSTIKPCPWCGESLKHARVIEGSTFRWRAMQGCCTDGPEVRHDTMAEDQAAAEEDSRKRAIEAWNTRAGDAND